MAWSGSLPPARGGRSSSGRSSLPLLARRALPSILSALVTAGLIFTLQGALRTQGPLDDGELPVPAFQYVPLKPDYDTASIVLPQTAKAPACSIYVLDVAQELSGMGPGCGRGEGGGGSGSGSWRARRALHDHRQAAPHHGHDLPPSTHTAPLSVFHEALANSKYVTRDIDAADVVYVHQHCYVDHWLAGLAHGHAHSRNAGAAMLQQALQWVKTTDRWQRNHGQDYVFFLPARDLVHVYDTCAALTSPLLIAPERGFRCAANPDYDMQLGNRTVLAPYMAPPDVPFELDMLAPRPDLLLFDGVCAAPGAEVSQGQRMRRYMVQQLQHDPRAAVHCRCSTCGQPPRHRRALLQAMRRAKFCLVLPGDRQATRRLTEAVLSGCIPVFAGPPYHSLPLAHVVPWARFAYFFAFDSTQLWPDHVAGAEEHAWGADADVSDVAIPVQSAHEMLLHLENLGTAEAGVRLAVMFQFRAYFWYQPALSHGKPMALDAILERVCHMHRRDVARWARDSAAAAAATLHKPPFVAQRAAVAPPNRRGHHWSMLEETAHHDSSSGEATKAALFESLSSTVHRAAKPPSGRGHWSLIGEAALHPHHADGQDAQPDVAGGPAAVAADSRAGDAGHGQPPATHQDQW